MHLEGDVLTVTYRPAFDEQVTQRIDIETLDVL